MTRSVAHGSVLGELLSRGGVDQRHFARLPQHELASSRGPDGPLALGNERERGAREAPHDLPLLGARRPQDMHAEGLGGMEDAPRALLTAKDGFVESTIEVEGRPPLRRLAASPPLRSR